MEFFYTRVWLTEMSQRLGRKATLDDIPDEDLMSEASYDRHGNDLLLGSGLYLDMPAWSYHVFEIKQ